MTRSVDLTTGSVSGHILRMAPPMATAFFAMMVFNLADTWFVSRLGTRALAAIGFTFPIVMLVHSISMGIGIGTSACVSRAIGKGDHDRVQHLATYSLLLTFLIMIVMTAVGMVAMEPVFRAIGAGDETRSLTMAYMRIWLVFIPLGALPMVGNNAIRATGDTLRPSLIMSTAALLNVVLDPILIFGAGPIPAMGIEGAAWATAGSRVLTLVWALWIMHRRCHLLTLRWTGCAELLRCWRDVLHVAVPAAATNILMPVTAGIIIRLIARFGENAVAATAAGQRIEHFAYLIPIAVGSVLVPLMGQNWGAGRLDRVRETWVKTNWFGIFYALGCLAVAIPAAHPIASCFTQEAYVADLIKGYLWIILTGAVLVHTCVHTVFAFNAIGHPLRASLLTAIRVAGLELPLAWAGGRLYGIYGIYGGISAAHIVCGGIALVWFDHVLKRSGPPCNALPRDPTPTPMRHESR